MTCQATDVVMVFQNGEELPVCSQVLRLASPVFDAMLGSGLVESQGGRIEVSIAEKETFEEVYELIKPCAWDPSKITKENLIGILKISNYYQLETIKKRCAAVLAGLPASLPHFWLARDHCVHEAYKKFIVKFGLNCTIFLATSLSKDKDAVKDVLLAVKNGQVQVKPQNVKGLLKLTEVVPMQEVKEMCGPVLMKRQRYLDAFLRQ